VADLLLNEREVKAIFNVMSNVAVSQPMRRQVLIKANLLTVFGEPILYFAGS
jgi:hypothetical protein